MNLKTLRALLEVAWNEETAYGDWKSKCPSLNQCAITSLIVQDYFEGKLLRCKMTNGEYHYWNQLPDGNQVDLTEDQFNFIQARPLKDKRVTINRNRILSFKSTIYRYQLLKSRLDRLLEIIT